MDSQPRIASYLASSSRVGIRPWNRRRDRQRIDRWPPYIPALPLHWVASSPRAPEQGECVSYAIDLLALSPDDRMIGRISARPVASAAWLGIALHPQQLGAGLGTESLALFAQLGQRLGLDGLLLDVAAENQRAVRCYQRVGFVAVGETWRGGYRYLDMMRSLCTPSSS